MSDINISVGGLAELITALTALVAAVSSLLARRDIRQNVGTSATDGTRTVHEALELQDEQLQALETKIENGNSNGRAP